MQGSQRPMALFTYDVSLEQIEMPEAPDSSPPTPGNEEQHAKEKVNWKMLRGKGYDFNKSGSELQFW